MDAGIMITPSAWGTSVQQLLGLQHVSGPLSSPSMVLFWQAYAGAGRCKKSSRCYGSF